MNYKNWNIRSFGGFWEEFEATEPNTDDGHRIISINEFRNADRYSSEERRQLIDYLTKCPGLYATTGIRKNAYTQKEVASYALFTDGEVLFDNLILEYIQQPDFIIPEKWFALIQKRGFVVPKLEFKEDYIDFDFFTAGHELFDNESPFKAIIL
jgi:hypothetical protein